MSACLEFVTKSVPILMEATHAVVRKGTCYKLMKYIAKVIHTA